MASQHVMLDLETLGTAQGSAILSIGAVKFDIRAPIFEAKSKFHIAVDPGDSQRLGFAFDWSTIVWWFSEDRAEARKLMLDNLEFSVDLASALDGFSQWYLADEDPDNLPCVWGNGSMFDNAMMQLAYKRAGEDCPWSYKKDMCFRTFRRLDPKGIFAPPNTVAHDALNDAVFQAQHLYNICAAFKIEV